MDKRFETVYPQQGFGRKIAVLKDKETGICYLYCSGGLTPLLNRDGKPVTM